MFVIFGIRVKHDEDNSDWFTRSQILDVIDGYGAEAAKTDSIYCIHKFKTWTMEIDFAHPELVQNELGELTMKVEQECPVSKTFGVSGVGEGIVWTAVPTTHVPFRVSDLIFKVKGEKHSETKVHTLAPVDVERINNIRQLVETIVTDHRLEKKLTDMVEQGFPLLVQNTSVFLKIVGTDVSKEEGDTIDASGLPRKEVMAAVSKRASQWFVKKASEA
jgi:hypothetical protein